MVDTSTPNLVYARAYRRGWWAACWAGLCGRSSQLLDLATLAPRGSVQGQHALGRQWVPIRQIRGSESRSTDFDAAFHPRRPQTHARWQRVAQAWLAGVALPPVELIRVGATYVVRDGHHRISVAAAFGAQEIDARVTVWEVAAPRPAAASAQTRRPAPSCAPRAAQEVMQSMPLW